MLSPASNRRLAVQVSLLIIADALRISAVVGDTIKTNGVNLVPRPTAG